MHVVAGYFDESGDLDMPPGIFCVSGYFVAVEAAKLMDTEWGKVLEKHKLPYFHMVDCAHGTGVFKDLPKEERVEVVKELIALIKLFTLEGFSIFATASAFHAIDDAQDIYSYCASSCASALQMFLKMGRVQGDIAYFFEQGHKSKGKAYTNIAQKVKRSADTLTFAPKEDIRLLQAADLLAWQSTKYAKDWLYPTRRGEKPTREPRKDFQSLMEHDHSFMHMELNADGEKAMGIELWPLSKRSQYTVNMKLDSDGPILVLREEGSDTPIIPVSKTVGWRMGGARLAQVGFVGMDEKPFALTFDEPRLIEAMTVLVGATKVYEGGKIVPVFSADDVVIDRFDDQAVLRIKLREAGSIGIHMTPEILARLKERLSDS
jgi:hypothetical protein